MNNQESMEKLNLRGRMAFAVADFEIAVSELDTVTEPIKKLIDYLWECTSTTDLSSWNKSINAMIYADDDEETAYKSFKDRYLLERLPDEDAKHIYETLKCTIGVARASMNEPYNSEDTIEALKVLDEQMHYYCPNRFPLPWDFKKAYMEEPVNDGKIDAWGKPIKREDFNLKPLANAHTECVHYLYKVIEYIDYHSEMYHPDDHIYDPAEEWDIFVREKKYYNECIDLINWEMLRVIPQSKIDQWRRDACDFDHFDKEKLREDRNECHELVWKNRSRLFGEVGSKEYDYKYSAYLALTELLADSSYAENDEALIEYFTIDIIRDCKVDQDKIEGLLRKYFGDVVKD